MRLAGKRALVTGAASGIGKAVVVTFQREGAEVIGADKDFPPAASGILNGGTAVFLDVSQETDWERLFQEVVPLDILVACAGISEAKPIPESSLGQQGHKQNP
jgi:NAD(P)-dependent dehydrogenase (short-subunit alcohol dehydrogenase family)